MTKIKKTSAALVCAGLMLVGCGSSDQLLGSDGSTVNQGSDDSPTIPVAAALGDPCVSSDEWNPNFSGFGAAEVNLEIGASQCETNICLMNHFQGRASCPYGQAAGASDCLLPDGSQPVLGRVAPQLVSRQAKVAAICSCHCDGAGPGPYCTCPESMQCEHLIQELGLGQSELEGSYCIPKGSEYDRSQAGATCVEPNCGPAHPH